MRLPTPLIFACCLMSACALGPLPTPAREIPVPPPPNLTQQPQALPPPRSGQMRDLEANHRVVTKAYHLVASQLCQLLAFLEQPLEEQCLAYQRAADAGAAPPPR